MSKQLTHVKPEDLSLRRKMYRSFFIDLPLITSACVMATYWGMGKFFKATPSNPLEILTESEIKRRTKVLKMARGVTVPFVFFIVACGVTIRAVKQRDRQVLRYNYLIEAHLEVLSEQFKQGIALSSN